MIALAWATTDASGQPTGSGSDQDTYTHTRETVPRPGKDPGRLADDNDMPIGKLEIGGAHDHSSKLTRTRVRLKGFMATAHFWHRIFRFAPMFPGDRL